ncbi:homoserine kinase [Sphingobium lignivorans]|uniref:Homoserine kinase n=1 Tax=Sphingobium lignivorans TaxID=2735886 RepID=A0ABR6NBB9_9SPHN|nr:homoserine kinase [Sphingobium lignivorans]MBB5984566.1 homoserine kinase type II [Sphingobium lignivorans]
MAVYTQVPAETLAAFLERYDVGTLVAAKGIAEGVENSNYLVDTTGADGTGARFILTLYEKRVDAADLPFFMALLDHLADKGLPVPPAVKDREGREIQELAGRPACLIRFLPGVSLSHPTPAQALAAGRAMADMHAAVADFTPTRANSMGMASWQPLFERCGRSLDEIAPGLHDDLGFAIDAVTAAWRPDDFDHVAIHADLFPDNVLMLGDKVTGLIDFYFACTDIRVYDLAIMHSAWSFDTTGRHHDAAVGDGLLRGYESRFPLSPFEQAQFRNLASGACIRFALSRAWDWLNTPADALVTRKDPLAYVRRLAHYAPELVRHAR